MTSFGSAQGRLWRCPKAHERGRSRLHR